MSNHKCPPKADIEAEAFDYLPLQQGRQIQHFGSGSLNALLGLPGSNLLHLAHLQLLRRTGMAMVALFTIQASLLSMEESARPALASVV